MYYCTEYAKIINVKFSQEVAAVQIPQDVKNLISAFECGGYSMYIVGGYVRDMLLGKSGGDVDLTTSALPAQAESVLENAGVRYIETGLKHGTITAVINHIPYEITTFRSDGAYSDSRHPESVSFVADVKEDLSRRDFTINAMAYNEADGLIDLFGGCEDLKNGVIRAVGNPDIRFKEDALRIMRALRFASQLGFKLEAETARAALENKALLDNISSERIYSELEKLLCGDNALFVLSEYREIFAQIIPELRPCFDCAQNTPWHIYNVYDHIVHSVAAAPKKSVIRLAMLLHDIGKPAVKVTLENGRDSFKRHAEKSAELALQILERFRVSNAVRDEAVTLVKYHQSVENVNDIRPKRWLNKIGYDYTRDLLDVRLADLKAHNPEKVGFEIEKIEEIKQQLEDIVKAGEAFRISDLAVNGNDLIALGFSGREIGEKLTEILNLVIDGKLANNKEEIISYIKN